MSTLPIMLQLNGHWDSIEICKDFNVDGIVVNEDSNYSQLNSAITEHLMIDTSAKIIEIKYTVNERCPPMKIRNDMGVRVYMETKKENRSLGMYPLCITVRDFDLECSISNSSTIRAKEKDLKFLRGHLVDSYSRLPSYLYILEKTYPRSVVKLQKAEDNCFLYAFVELSTSIKGWEYCRLVVVVDGTFLRSAYMGIMLTASTMDATSSILPLAYAVVDSENDTSWMWFFEKFKHAYGEKPNMCVVLDRNESILNATSTVYTSMPHYACMWHIWTNVRSKFKKGHLKLSKLYFATARPYTLDEFNERMSQIEVIDTCFKAYLYDIGYHRWSRVHATVNRTWTMTSNIADSLNAVTKDARELPVVELLEYMRALLEHWTNEKLLKAKGTFTYLGKKIQQRVGGQQDIIAEDEMRASTYHIHTVIDGVKRFIVCLQNKRCSCGQFQLDVLPCAQALAALRHRNESYENYCSPYYTRESLLHTYEIPVDPLPDESKWNVPQHIIEEVVMPPTGKDSQGDLKNKDTIHMMK
uniref:SWIM-type domain-containing protein n=1 Tax=Nicotiana tabacum TaxID=4097 RepID=A0A1S4D0U8_TOBAC|nr:PREDICTED: uncharacterized protein LOC107824764 [Nicotiana tabacum]